MEHHESVADIVNGSLSDRNVRFVFPSAVAADAWALRIVDSASARAVDRERFIAWDRFKALTLSSERSDRSPANGAARSIFCASVLAENAAAAADGKAVFEELVVPEYAADWGAFVSSLSRTLPALDGFFRRNDGALPEEAYFSDLRLLRDRYAQFLERNLLYEPAWDRVPFRESASRWILLFPELAEDWDQYEAELRTAATIRVVPVDALAPPADMPDAVRRLAGDSAGKLLEFAGAQDEIRWIAGFAARLIDEGGIAPSDIAVSVPGIDDYVDRLALEFRIRDLPVDIRKGRPIPEHPAGRLFASLAACRSTRWSFRAWKDVLLDRAYPWKDRPAIDSLMDFGLRFRCVSGYPEDGKEVDVWERSFDRLEEVAEELRIPIRSIAPFYRKLKKDIRNVVQAPDFSELRNRLIQFKSNNFDPYGMDEETDRVFSRALEELAELAETEKRLSGVRINDPYGLFLTHLKSVNYVFQASDPGVLVYDYRVAAGIAPAAHIVANAVQSAVSVRADPAPFLREDRKLRARIEDRDLSAAFIRAYELSGSLVLFTAPQNGFSGFSVPHRILLEERFRSDRPAKDLLAGRPDSVAAELEASPPEGSAATTVLASARRIADSVSARSGIDARKTPFGAEQLRGRLLARLCGDADKPRISPTDLNDLASCPFSWLLRRGLGIKDKETEIETVDARDLGMLYHRILERLFDRIAADSPRFRAERLEAYKLFLAEETDAALAERSRNEGAFQESVYGMYRTRILSSLEAFLDAVAEELDGSAMIGTELPLRREYPEFALALAGLADLALRSDSGSVSVYDFKTGLVPKTGALLPDESGLMGDYQMASYVRMLESGDDSKVAEAAFYSIENRQFRRVVSERGGKRSRSPLPMPRAEYGLALDVLDEAVQAASATVREADFPVPPPGSRAPCAACRVSAVCRIPFAGGER